MDDLNIDRTAKDALGAVVYADESEKFTKDTQVREFKVFKSEHEVKNFCCDCKYRSECIILKHVNKLSMKRDSVAADKVWGCSTFKEDD